MIARLRPQLAPVPSFAFPEAAAVALAHVTRYGEWLRTALASADGIDPLGLLLWRLRAEFDAVRAQVRPAEPLNITERLLVLSAKQ